VVHWLKQTYAIGVRLTSKQMATLEHRFERLTGLDKWFVRIAPL